MLKCAAQRGVPLPLPLRLPLYLLLPPQWLSTGGSGSVRGSELVSTVTYRSSSPASSDAVKLRLPDALTERRRLVFAVLHVPCKRKTSRFGKVLQTEESVAELLGVASLPLLR